MSPEQEREEPRCAMVGAWRTNAGRVAGEDAQAVGRASGL